LGLKNREKGNSRGGVEKYYQEREENAQEEQTRLKKKQPELSLKKRG